MARPRHRSRRDERSLAELDRLHRHGEQVSGHATEIESFLKTAPAPLTIIASDPTIEDPVAFAMEQHLEAFLVTNWEQTELAKTFSIFEEDGEKVGQQYETDAAPSTSSRSARTANACSWSS